MPDITFVIRDISGPEEAEKLERALLRLDSVKLVNVDSESGLVAVSHKGGGPQIREIGDSIKNTGHDFELSPGAEHAQE